MSMIREDLVGAVYVGGHVLFAGDEVPEGVEVGEHLVAPDESDESAGDEVPEGVEVGEQAPAVKRGRPRKDAAEK